MKIQKFAIILIVSLFTFTSAFGMNNSQTYVNFEKYYKEITNPDRTINIKKLERIFNTNPELKRNFSVLLYLLKQVKGPRVTLLFFEKNGERFPRLQIGDQNSSIYIDVHGEQERFMRLGNAFYSVNEMTNPVLFFKKYFESNPKVDRDYQAYLSKQKINMTRKMWNAMSSEERVLFMGGMRALLVDAERVIAAFEKNNTRSRKTAWIEALIQRAYADEPGGEGEVQGGGGSSPPDKCVIAGYISKYENNKCTTNGIQNYAACENAGEFSCNPLIFGYKEGRKPFCQPVSSRGFQTATKNCHDGEGFSKIDTPENIKKFVKSILEAKDKNMDEFFNADLVKPGKMDELKSFLNPVIEKIDEAIAKCSLSGHENFDREQASACAALNDRKLKFSSYLEGLQMEVATGQPRGTCPLEQPQPGQLVPTPAGGAPTASLPAPTPVVGGGPGGPAVGAAVVPGGPAVGGVATCGAQVPGAPGGVAIGGYGTPPNAQGPPKDSPGFFSRAFGWIGTAASGVWGFLKDNKSLFLGLGIAGLVGWGIYELTKKPKTKSSPPPYKDPVVPPVSVPITSPTVTPQPIEGTR